MTNLEQILKKLGIIEKKITSNIMWEAKDIGIINEALLRLTNVATMQLEASELDKKQRQDEHHAKMVKMREAKLRDRENYEKYLEKQLKEFKEGTVKLNTVQTEQKIGLGKGIMGK